MVILNNVINIGVTGAKRSKLITSDSVVCRYIFMLLHCLFVFILYCHLTWLLLGCLLCHLISSYCCLGFYSVLSYPIAVVCVCACVRACVCACVRVYSVFSYRLTLGWVFFLYCLFCLVASCHCCLSVCSVLFILSCRIVSLLVECFFWIVTSFTVVWFLLCIILSCHCCLVVYSVFSYKKCLLWIVILCRFCLYTETPFKPDEVGNEQNFRFKGISGLKEFWQQDQISTFFSKHGRLVLYFVQNGIDQ
jgi:hypothetical protein